MIKIEFSRNNMSASITNFKPSKQNRQFSCFFLPKLFFFFHTVSLCIRIKITYRQPKKTRGKEAWERFQCRLHFELFQMLAEIERERKKKKLCGRPTINPKKNLHHFNKYVIQEDLTLKALSAFIILCRTALISQWSCFQQAGKLWALLHVGHR